MQRYPPTDRAAKAPAQAIADRGRGFRTSHHGRPELQRNLQPVDGPSHERKLFRGAIFGIVAGQHCEIGLPLQVRIGVLDERLEVEVVLLVCAREMQVPEMNPREDGTGVFGSWG